MSARFYEQENNRIEQIFVVIVRGGNGGAPAPIF